MNGQPNTAQVIDLYFEGINSDNVALIPLTDDVEFTGQMMPEPVKGKSAVHQHIADVAPFVARLDRRTTVVEGDNVAVTMEFEGVNGVMILGAAFFQVRDGSICSIQTFFDTRALFKGAE